MKEGFLLAYERIPGTQKEVQERALRRGAVPCAGMGSKLGHREVQVVGDGITGVTA